MNCARPLVTVLVVNYNTACLLQDMYSDLYAGDNGVDLNFVIIDNASCDGSVAVIDQTFSGAHVIVNKNNVGFGRANNQALPYIKGDFLLLLNTDAFVRQDTLQKTVTYMTMHKECGVLGVKLVGRDKSLQPSCRYFPTPLNVFLSRTGLDRFVPWVRLVDDLSWDHASVRECDWVPGCYYLIRREVVDRVGLFDPRFFLYYEEVDHCRRVKEAGWKVVYFPDTEVVHIGGESAKSAGKLSEAGRQLSDMQVESELLYFRKHYGRMGLTLHMLLVALGDFILVVKHLLKGRWRAISASCKNDMLVWRLLRATHWATRPTR